MAAGAPSITATNAGNVEHGRVALGGPVFVFLQVVGYATLIGALLVTVDSLRRPARDFGGDSARRWMWAGPQLALLVLIALAWAASLLKLLPSLLATVVGFLTLYLFFCAILQIAYLLVVVFPRHREPIPPDVDQELPNE